MSNKPRPRPMSNEPRRRPMSDEPRRRMMSDGHLLRLVSSRRLLRCGLVAGPLFVAVFLLAGAFKGSGYDALRHPVSSLALGPGGWVQTANFLVAGTLTLAFAAGVWRSASRVGAVLIAVWGIGLIGAGLFRTDPVSGFPIGTPPLPDYTTLGALHDGFSLPAFLAIAVVQLVMSRGHGPAWFRYSLLSATTYLACFVLASAGFNQVAGLVEVGGLFQRLTVAIGWAWLALLALRLLARR